MQRCFFFNDPINSAALPFQGDPAFELSCVQAYNDALAEWRDISERYIPLAIIPYGSDIRTITREVERAVSRGHKGIVMVAEPSMAGNGLKHLNDPYWDTLWDTAQELNIPINWHAHAGIKLLPDKWQSHQAMRRTAAFSVQPQLIPNLILSGLADRYPRLKWVCAETGMGWLAYLIQACDYLWERKQLWREGVTTRPSEVFKRQIYVTFWYEREGISMRSFISPENIMWASDYPHATSTYPNSWEAVDAVIKHVDEADKGKLLWENAARLYKLMEYAKDTVGVA